MSPIDILVTVGSTGVTFGGPRLVQQLWQPASDLARWARVQNLRIEISDELSDELRN